jgi:hypothetical protein
MAPAQLSPTASPTVNTVERGGKLYLCSMHPDITDVDVIAANKSHGLVLRKNPPSCKVLSTRVSITDMYNALLLQLDDADNDFDSAIPGKVTWAEVSTGWCG